MNNMLLYTAIGDSYGLSFEFTSIEHILKNNDALEYKQREIATKGWQDHFPGRYSDDTDCAIAVIETMVAYYVFDATDFIAMWQGVFSRDPNRGYSKQTKNMLATMTPLDIVHNSRNSTSNGCLMGAHFLGLYATKNAVMKACVNKCLAMQANPEAIRATTFIAMVAHYLYYTDMSMTDCLNTATKDVLFKVDVELQKPIACDALITAQAIYNILIQAKTKQEVLIKSVALGGDVDSVASIALGLAALRLTTDKLPPAFYANLEPMAGSSNFDKLWITLLSKYPAIK